MILQNTTQISFYAVQEAKDPHLPPHQLHPLLSILKDAHEYMLVVKILRTLKFTWESQKIAQLQI